MSSPSEAIRDSFPTGRDPSTAPIHVPSLDGLRAAAVASVMLFHVGFPGFRPMGALGVDLFFVLSGFLITTLLIQEHDRQGRIRLGHFWGRRFLRLMPAYYAYAAFISLSILAFRSGWISEAPVRGWDISDLLLSIWLYFVNYAPASELWSRSDWIVHLWSLAVEEQFYLIWPPVLALALRVRRGVWCTWALVAAVAVNRMFYPPYEMTHRLDSRGLGIVLGCAVAFTLRGPAQAPARRILGTSRIRLLACMGILSLAVSAMFLGHRGAASQFALDRFTLPAFDLMFAILVASLYYGPSDAVAHVLSFRPVVYVGKISYGIYLYHMICKYLVWEVLLSAIGDWPRLPKYSARIAAFAALSVGMASMSYYSLERPFLKLKDRFR